MWTEGDLCEWVLFSFSKITKNHENRSLCRFRAVNVGCPIILQPRDHFHWLQRGKRVQKSLFHHCFLQNGTFLDHTNGETTRLIQEGSKGLKKIQLKASGAGCVQVHIVREILHPKIVIGHDDPSVAARQIAKAPICKADPSIDGVNSGDTGRREEE